MCPTTPHAWPGEVMNMALHASVVVMTSMSLTADGCLGPQYRNPWGFVRMGKILEDLDSLAGNIAYEHW